eukprot:6064342-Pleurochrysis_carterae.AAC.3
MQHLQERVDKALATGSDEFLLFCYALLFATLGTPRGMIGSRCFETFMGERRRQKNGGHPHERRKRRVQNGQSGALEVAVRDAALVQVLDALDDLRPTSRRRARRVDETKHELERWDW